MEQTPDLNQIIRLAKSPAGQKLMELLQQQSNGQLESAAKMASQGDYVQAKNVLSKLLASPEAKALLKTLEDSK